MKFKYYGKAPEIDGSGFNFRVDSVVNTYEAALLQMDFLPELQPGCELLPIPEYTPWGWVFKQLEDSSGRLVARYEPIRDSIDPRDEYPKDPELRIYVVKTIKQEYIEDER